MTEQTVNYPMLLEHMPVGITVLNTSLEIVYANPFALKILGLQYQETVGRIVSDPMWKLVDTQMKELPLDKYPAVRALNSRKPVDNVVFGVSNPNGDNHSWLLASAYPELNSEDQVERIVVTFTDVSFQRNKIPFEQIVHNANDVVVVTEANPLRNGGPNIVYVNEAFEELTGYSAEEVIGRTPRILQGERTTKEVTDAIYNQLSEGKEVKQEVFNYSKNGDGYWIELNIIPLFNAQDEITHFAAIERDITERKMKEADLSDKALKDALTGVYNRFGFESQLLELVYNQKQKSSPFCVALIDADHFKKVNDAYGHDVGDTVLKHIAKTLKDQLRETDLVCRYGGEEFVVILKNAKASDALVRLNKLREAIGSLPIEVPKQPTIRVTVSIGFSTTTGEGAVTSQTVETLIKEADKALYQAKSMGRNRVESSS
jgi:diguanylate cyclase (GGDEF)-like protein/PAS domain S-box-containing protein